MENHHKILETLRFFLQQKLHIFLQNPESVLEFPVFEQPRISILLILYNKAEYTYQCLETIKAHADVPYEIILVDNGSTDATDQLTNKLRNVELIRIPDNVGFLKGCNLGAKRTRGEWILFLNNDTQITPGLLSSLLDTAGKHPDCGAVGGKLIFPDGKLQEAGSILWNDGSAMGYGRGDDPFKPEYSYVKEVDYCSGACMLVNNKIFKSAGMFDDEFSPAYYEEADLSTRIWQLGYKVLYQPSATVIHYEFGSSGSWEEAIQLQIQNREKFISKWKSELAYFTPYSPEAILQARERSQRKVRILVIDDRVPVPNLGSGYPRSYMVLESLAETGYQTTFFPLQFPEKVQPHTHILEQKGIEIFFNKNLRKKRDFKQFYEERKDYYDVIWISRPHNLKEVFDVIKSMNPQQKVIYDVEALFSVRDILQLELNGKRLSEREKQQHIKQEMDMICKADIVISVSESERQIMQDYGMKDVKILGISLKAQPTPNRFEQRKDILFVGGFLESPCPNEDAIMYFVNQIYPYVYQKLGAKLWIVGTNYVDSIRNLQSDQIEVTGQVDRLWDFYNECKVFVVPTRYAAGIPFKLHEAMAHGLPSVVTPLIAEQTGFSNDKILVGYNPKDFAKKIIKLYRDKETWELLRKNGLKQIEEKSNLGVYRKALAEIQDLVRQERDKNWMK